MKIAYFKVIKVRDNSLIRLPHLIPKLKSLMGNFDVFMNEKNGHTHNNFLHRLDRMFFNSNHCRNTLSGKNVPNI